MSGHRYVLWIRVVVCSAERIKSISSPVLCGPEMTGRLGSVHVSQPFVFRESIVCIKTQWKRDVCVTHDTTDGFGSPELNIL